MKKQEWRKEEKEFYLPKAIPTLVTIPKMRYFTISGKGNPNNNKDFQEKIGVLYSLSYAVRMMPKNGYIPNGYFEYTVYPLEGIWSGNTLDKDSFVYTIMIRQPDFVDDEIFNKALEITRKKNPSILLEDVKLETIEDGLCVQMLHIGPYDMESMTFEKMDEFIQENNYGRTTITHREIYLSDPNKVLPEKVSTVLRYSISRNKSI